MISEPDSGSPRKVQYLRPGFQFLSQKLAVLIVGNVGRMPRTA